MSQERNGDSARAVVEGVADLMLERYRLGELPRSEMERLERRLSGDESLRERLADLERSDEELRRRPPDWLAHGVSERVRVRAANQPRWRSASAAWVAASAVAAMIAVVWLRPDLRASFTASLQEPLEVDSGADRPKGAPAALVVYRNTEAGSETLSDNDVVREGDLIRVAYRSAAPGYGAILSVDGRGLVTPHMPVEGTRAVSLRTGEMVLLDRAFELDDAPRGEFFFLITGPSPFDLSLARDALREALVEVRDGSPAPLRLPSQLRYVTLSLRKETK